MSTIEEGKGQTMEAVLEAAGIVPIEGVTYVVGSSGAIYENHQEYDPQLGRSTGRLNVEPIGFTQAETPAQEG